jgi:hypothetical protein
MTKFINWGSAAEAGRTPQKKAAAAAEVKSRALISLMTLSICPY